MPVPRIFVTLAAMATPSNDVTRRSAPGLHASGRRPRPAGLSIDEVRGGRALLVMFLCRHCPYVKHVEQEVAPPGRDYEEARHRGSRPTTRWRTRGLPASLKERAAKVSFTFPYLYDENQTVAQAYGAVCTPEFFLFDATPKLAYHGRLDATRTGREPANGADLRAALDAVLAGRALSGAQHASRLLDQVEALIPVPSAPLRLALAQTTAVRGDVVANLASARALVTEAAVRGAHVVVFPELFATGYCELGWLRTTPTSWLSKRTPGSTRCAAHVRTRGSRRSWARRCERLDGEKVIAAPVIGPAGDQGISVKEHVHGSEADLFRAGAHAAAVRSERLEDHDRDLLRRVAPRARHAGRARRGRYLCRLGALRPGRRATERSAVRRAPWTTGSFRRSSGHAGTCGADVVRPQRRVGAERRSRGAGRPC